MIIKKLGLAVFASVLAASVSSARADDFTWKTLTIRVGTTVGGGFDNYARLLARHIGEFLPGKPNVIVENRPGAGGMIAFNYLYNIAPKDGTEIASSAPGLLLDRLIYQDKSNAKYDAVRFQAIGSMTQDFSVFIVRTKSGLNLDDVMKGKTYNVGTAGPGGNPEIYGRALNSLLKTKLKLVAGYPGMAQVQMAMESAELDGIPGVPWADLYAQKRAWFTDGFATPILQYRIERSPQLKDVPTVLELTSDDSYKEAFTVLMMREEISRPFLAPPDTPKDRVATLRTAFEQSMKSQSMIDEAKRMSVSIDWLPGDKVDEIVRKMTTPSEKTAGYIRDIFN
ncbi:MAG TPA: tripartite tricarboxylate transporter substrate-binding protein [Alphaproteobacteria bacterium]|jgi:tripartite-type tricarboxylate transporter receptor subunit TctC